MHLSFQISRDRGALSRGSATKLCSSQRESTAPPASACLNPTPQEVRAGTATHPCSLGGSGLAGRRQTKPTQHSCQPGILEDLAISRIMLGLIIVGQRLLSACIPLSSLILKEFGFSHLKISREGHINTNPTMELNLLTEPWGKVWLLLAAILMGTLLEALRILPAGAQILSQMNAEAMPHLSPQQPAEGRN